MSIPVDVADLPETAARYSRSAFFLSTGDDFRPHVLHVPVDFADGRLHVTGSRRACANVTARPLVGLVWPPGDDGYTLIVDGEAAADGDGRITVTPTKGVLHRPAPA